MSGLRDRLQRIAAAKRDRVDVGRIGLDVDVVELVNWVYADQKAHTIDGRGIGLHAGERAAAGLAHRLRSAHGQFEAVARLGCRIDQQGHDAGELHPVAEAVNDLVGRMLSGRATIVNFASRAEIPAGASFQPTLGPQWKVEPRWDLLPGDDGQLRRTPKQGAFRIVYDRHKQQNHCPIDYDHGPAFVAELRAEYMCWHDALSELVALCCRHRARLGGLIVTGPRLLREPWRAGTTENSPHG